VFADKGRSESYSSDRSLPLGIQKQLIEERRRVRKMDVCNPVWSIYEMDEQNFEKLNSAFANAFPEAYEKLERLRNDMPADIESNIKIVKEEKVRIAKLEKEDPRHTKCDGRLVPDVGYKNSKYKKCTKCGRRLVTT
jgi:hypothetical protein